MKNNQTKFTQTEVGLIPEDWEVLRFDEIAELKKEGYLPKPGDSFPYLGLEHIDQQTLSINSIGNSDNVNSNKSRFKSGDILFGKLRPYFKKIYRPKFDGICSTDIWVIKAKEGIDQAWLHWFVANQDFVDMSTSGSKGTKMPRADWGQISISEWPIPPLFEQKRIAEVLGALDEKIELNRKMNKTLEQIGQAIFKRLSAKGIKVLKISPLSDFGKIVCGKTPSKANSEYFSGETPLIKIPDMHGQTFIIKTEDSLTEKGKASQANKTIPANSICVSCIATVGLVSLTSEESQTNQQINSIIPNKKEFTYYLYFTLKNIAQDIRDMASGGSATLNLNTGTFSNIELVTPEDNILMKFDNAVRPIFEQIYINLKQIGTLSQIRDSLLPRLMSGKLRVR